MLLQAGRTSIEVRESGAEVVVKRRNSASDLLLGYLGTKCRREGSECMPGDDSRSGSGARSAQSTCRAPASNPGRGKCPMIIAHDALVLFS